MLKRIALLVFLILIATSVLAPCVAIGSKPDCDLLPDEMNNDACLRSGCVWTIHKTCEGPPGCKAYDNSEYDCQLHEFAGCQYVGIPDCYSGGVSSCASLTDSGLCNFITWCSYYPDCTPTDFDSSWDCFSAFTDSCGTFRSARGCLSGLVCQSHECVSSADDPDSGGSEGCVPPCDLHSDTPYCNVETGKCVECLINENCGTKEACWSNICVGSYCQSPTPYWNEGSQECVQCIEDSHCGADECCQWLSSGAGGDSGYCAPKCAITIYEGETYIIGTACRRQVFDCRANCATGLCPNENTKTCEVCNTSIGCSPPCPQGEFCCESGSDYSCYLKCDPRRVPVSSSPGGSCVNTICDQSFECLNMCDESANLVCVNRACECAEGYEEVIGSCLPDPNNCTPNPPDPSWECYDYFDADCEVDYEKDCSFFDICVNHSCLSERDICKMQGVECGSFRFWGVSPSERIDCGDNCGSGTCVNNECVASTDCTPTDYDSSWECFSAFTDSCGNARNALECPGAQECVGTVCEIGDCECLLDTDCSDVYGAGWSCSDCSCSGPECSDGTGYGLCSEEKPNYCANTLKQGHVLWENRKNQCRTRL